MSSSSPDLRFLAEAVPQIKDYLFSNELYWPLSGSAPRLTLGALLLFLARVRLSHPQEIARYQPQVDEQRTQWQSLWQKKAQREITSRVRLWSQFFGDYADAPEQAAQEYATQARGRAILQLLMREVPAAPEKASLDELDAGLKARLNPSEFIWEAELQAGFSQTDFWFLYVKP